MAHSSASPLTHVVRVLLVLSAIVTTGRGCYVIQQHGGGGPSTVAHPRFDSLYSKCRPAPDPYGGTGLCATEDIAKGDVIVEVPAGMIACARSTPSDTPTRIAFETADVLCGDPGRQTVDRDLWWLASSLATWRLACQQTPLGGDSIVGVTASEVFAEQPWESARWQLPALWPDGLLDEALREAAGGATEEDGEQRASIESACGEVKERIKHQSIGASRLSEELSPRLNKAGFNFSQGSIERACREAMALVLSRALRLPSSDRLAMVPVLELVNHADKANVIFDDDAAEDSSVRMVATRSIGKDMPISVNYGTDATGKGKSAAILFCGYGFVPDGRRTATPVGRVLADASLIGQTKARKLLGI